MNQQELWVGRKADKRGQSDALHGMLQVPYRKRGPTTASRHSIIPDQTEVFRSVYCTQMLAEVAKPRFFRWSTWSQISRRRRHAIHSRFVLSTELRLPTIFNRSQITLHQGAIEAMFLDSMRTQGVEVDRGIVPTSMHILKDPKLLQDPASYPVQVSHSRSPT